MVLDVWIMNDTWWISLLRTRKNKKKPIRNIQAVSYLLMLKTITQNLSLLIPRHTKMLPEHTELFCGRTELLPGTQNCFIGHTDLLPSYTTMFPWHTKLIPRHTAEGFWGAPRAFWGRLKRLQSANQLFFNEG